MWPPTVKENAARTRFSTVGIPFEEQLLDTWQKNVITFINFFHYVLQFILVVYRLLENEVL
jgi:hypothetical protein